MTKIENLITQKRNRNFHIIIGERERERESYLPPPLCWIDLFSLFSLSLSRLRVCLIGVKTGRMENRERKIWWKMLFSTIWLRKENRRDRKQRRKFSLGPTFFILPNWEENKEGKVMRNAFYTNNPTLLHSPTLSLSHNYRTRT